jgi:hypothetical protein
LDEEKMKHEFKVTKSKDQTVYTLESASSGGTSSGSGASVSTALGGVQRRPTDSIFAQEAKKDETPKPRNFVAKNAKMGGAGKMKDKSKTIPRHEKHKKPVAEGERTMSRAAKGHEKYGKDGMKALAKAGRDGASDEKLDAIRDKHDKYDEGVTGPEKCWPGHRKVGTQPGTGKNAGKRVNDCEKIGEQGVAEDDNGKDTFYYQRNNIWRVMDGDELVYKYTPDRYEVVGAKKLLARFDDEGYDVTHVISPMGTVTHLYGKPEDDMEEGAAEDHEIQMASSELQSIAKNAEHLLDLVRKYSEQQGLQAWQQSKITKAADYLNSVLQSINGEQSGMEEARNNYHANTAGFGRGPRDDERHDLDTQADPRETMMWNLTVDGKPLNPEPIMGRSNLIKFGKQQAASGVDLSNAVISPVKEMEEDAYMMELAAKLAEKIPANADVDYYIKDFAKSTAPQFKGKNPAKRKQMAIAAYYGSKQKKK